MISLNKKNLLGADDDEGGVFSAIMNVVLTTVIVLLLLIIFAKTFVFSPITVWGSSMRETFHSNDIVLMDKLRTPRYGDVVIIKISATENHIKRLIGLPGDRIYTEEGIVHRVSGGVDTALDEPYAFYLAGYRRGTFKDGINSLTGRREWVDFSVTLSDDEIFVLGDNRYNSHDSRALSVQYKYSAILGVVPDWAISIKGFTTDYYNYSEKLRTRIYGFFGFKEEI